MFLFYVFGLIFLLVVGWVIAMLVARVSSNHAANNKRFAKKGSGDGSSYDGGDTSDWGSDSSDGGGGDGGGGGD